MTARRRPELAVAAALFVLLLATAGRYGYHRDELYFLAAGHHLAWGYPDQPPLVPAIARLVSILAPHSLVLLRLPSALSVALVVVLTGAMARRLGADERGQLLAAGATAISGYALGMGHLLSTATFDLLGWTSITYVVLRILQGDDRRLWLVAGLVAGVTMQANVLVAFLLLGLCAGIALAGPRRVLTSPWPWAAATLALVIGLPYLLWQADHGWPQLDVASGIAHGQSGTSSSRLAFVPMLLLQVGPWLLPIWLLGLVRLWNDARLRAFAATFGVLLVVFLILGGKPYYLAGLIPLLLAAGAQPLLDRASARTVAVLLVLSTPALVFTLPLLPVQAADVVAAVNYDAGETVGWPEHVREIASAWNALPGGTAVVAGNYGEAGAVDRYGEALGLPPAYSGHNGYAAWGHPAGATPALMVGGDPGLLRRSCAELRTVGRLRQVHGVDNDEDGTPLRYCVPRRSWRELWPELTHIG